MRIGKFDVKWDGNCYVVGIGKDVERPDGRKERRIISPKYHANLEQTLRGIVDRRVSEEFNACEDLGALRERMREIAAEIEEPLRNAVAGALQAGCSESKAG